MDTKIDAPQYDITELSDDDYTVYWIALMIMLVIILICNKHAGKKTTKIATITVTDADGGTFNIPSMG